MIFVKITIMLVLQMLTGAAMKSSIFNCSSVIAGQRASFEDAFWDDLWQIDKEYDEALSESDREFGNLSSPSRLFVLGLLRRPRTH